MCYCGECYEEENRCGCRVSDRTEIFGEKCAKDRRWEPFSDLYNPSAGRNQRDTGKYQKDEMMK